MNHDVSRSRAFGLDTVRLTALMATAVVAAMLFGLCAQAFAAEDPSEATGHDLYRRGFYNKAIEEWTRAVDKGDMGAAFRLGEEYFDAKVVERDVDQAVKYLQIGADGGEPRAQMDLATMYDHGWGVPSDPAMAAKWYLAAADQGLPEAQYNIGTMYETGEGVDQSIERAYMYYLLAVENGFPQFAARELDKISRTMTPTQIKNATRLARDYQAERRVVLQ